MGAPVCNINPKNPVPTSLTPNLPAIPLATNDLASIVAALNAIRQWIQQFSNSIPQSNVNFNFNPDNPGNINNYYQNGGGGGPNPGAAGDFSEVTASRVTTDQQIYDPNDPTGQTYVTVSQITGLKFTNKLGQTVVWQQTP